MKRAMMSAALLAAVVVSQLGAQVKSGADLLFEKHFALVDGKRLGLVTNHSALLSDGRHLADALTADKRVKLVALFGPEHGIRGDAAAGDVIADEVDPATGVRVYSLYGRTRKPTTEMLRDVEVFIFDIFDVGVRFYTYESTLSYAMEAAAEQNIPFIVLDRPNPIRGTHVEGFIRLDSLRSFVGLHPTPIAHGMTMGELARLFNGEGWLENAVRADLTVVAMEGWKRSMWYDETGLRWVPPSPNIPTLATATVYPGTCLIEGSNLSEGRGTERPFEYIGAPFVDGERWALLLNEQRLPGVKFRSVEFTPRDIPGVATNPKHKGVRCGGVFVEVTDREILEPVKTGVTLISTARRMFGGQLTWRESAIDRLSGTPEFRRMIDAGMTGEEIAAAWKEQVETFRLLRRNYLLYE